MHARVSVNTKKSLIYKDILSSTSELLTHIELIDNMNINWDDYHRSASLSIEEYSFMMSFDKSTTAYRNRIMLLNTTKCVGTFSSILSHDHSDVTMLKYCLVLLYKMFEFNKGTVKYFHEHAINNESNLWKPFHRLLNHQDSIVTHISAVIVTMLASWSFYRMDNEAIRFFMLWLQAQIKDDKNLQHDSLRCLQVLLQRPEYRADFDNVEGISFLVDMLRRKHNFQIQYQLIFCLWIITFSPRIAAKETLTNNVIKLLSEGLKDSAKAKVVRITLAVYRNLLSKPRDKRTIRLNAIIMIRNKILKQLFMLRKQHIPDEELTDDIAFLIQHLSPVMKELSSYDIFLSELRSGELKWSPAHRSNEFWAENVHRLNENNYEHLRMLTELLETSRDSKVLSVACFDIGQYVVFYPPGKKIIEHIGAKNVIMSYLQHKDPNVKYEALIAVQKIMIRNLGWLQNLVEEDQRTSDSRSEELEET